VAAFPESYIESGYEQHCLGTPNSGRSYARRAHASRSCPRSWMPCPPLQHLRQPAPAARDDLIALWCRLRDAQPTQPSSRAELQQARLALGSLRGALRRAQRGQSSASQLATNPRQRLWCHLARGQGPRHRKQGPSSRFWVPIEEAKETPTGRPRRQHRGHTVCTGPDFKIQKLDSSHFLCFPFLLDCLEENTGQRTNT